MGTVTVNISFQDTLLAEIDEEARREARSRSELLREAARHYIERQRRWDAVFNLGERTTEQQGLTPEDVAMEIEEVREERRQGKRP